MLLYFASIVATDKSITNYDRVTENDDPDEVNDLIGETTFIKPIKKVRSSGIIHSVEDLSTNSTWVYRKNSGTDSNRGSRRKRNAFANDEIISKIQAHLEKNLLTSPASSSTTGREKGLSRSMDIPTSNVPQSQQQIHYDHQFQDGEIKLDQTLQQQHSEMSVTVLPIGTANNNRLSSVENEETEKTVGCFARYLDINLLKDPTFILMCLSVTLMSVGCPYMLYYLPAHAVSIGIKNYYKSCQTFRI